MKRKQGRPVTNRNNYWSDGHRFALYYLAAKVLRRYPNTNLVLDDLVNHAWLKQARRYKNIKGLTYYCYLHMQQLVNEDKRLCISDLNMVNDENVLHEDTYEPDLGEENFEHLVSLLNNEHYKDIIKLRFKDDLTLKEIGDIYGVSNETIRTRLKDAIHELRSALDD